MSVSDAHLHQLGVPPDAEEAGGHEVLRAFVVDGGLSVSLQRAFDDPATWGLLLADLARHAARIYAMETDASQEEALERMREAFEAASLRPAEIGASDTIN